MPQNHLSTSQSVSLAEIRAVIDCINYYYFVLQLHQYSTIQFSNKLRKRVNIS